MRTFWEFETFWMAWTQFGAIYIAHQYVEWKNTKYNQTLKCEVCGHKEMVRTKT